MNWRNHSVVVQELLSSSHSIPLFALSTAKPFTQCKYKAKIKKNFSCFPIIIENSKQAILVVKYVIILYMVWFIYKQIGTKVSSVFLAELSYILCNFALSHASYLDQHFNPMTFRKSSKKRACAKQTDITRFKIQYFIEKSKYNFGSQLK